MKDAIKILKNIRAKRPDLTKLYYRERKMTETKVKAKKSGKRRAKGSVYVRGSTQLSKRLKDAERKLMKPGKTLTGFRSAFVGWMYWIKLCISDLEKKIRSLSVRKSPVRKTKRNRQKR